MTIRPSIRLEAGQYHDKLRSVPRHSIYILSRSGILKRALSLSVVALLLWLAYFRRIEHGFADLI